MTPEIEKAIKLLAEKITPGIRSEDALKFTQAVLNLTHAAITLHNLKNK